MSKKSLNMTSPNIMIYLGDDYQEIKLKLDSISEQVGKKINVNALVRHLLKQVTSYKYLYEIGFISYSDYLKETLPKPKRKEKKFI